MKKPYAYNQFHNTMRCCDCFKKLKLNVVIRKESKKIRCFRCHKKANPKMNSGAGWMHRPESRHYPNWQGTRR